VVDRVDLYLLGVIHQCDVDARELNASRIGGKHIRLVDSKQPYGTTPTSMSVNRDAVSAVHLLARILQQSET
jgi:hypothetical protein